MTLPDRTPTEMERVTRVANGLLALLHAEWDAENADHGDLHPADFIEAAIAATASIAAQHVCPHSDLAQALTDNTALFQEAFFVEMFAEIRRRRCS